MDFHESSSFSPPWLLPSLLGNDLSDSFDRKSRDVESLGWEGSLGWVVKRRGGDRFDASEY
jgi:hypothetical protein